MRDSDPLLGGTVVYIAGRRSSAIGQQAIDPHCRRDEELLQPGPTPQPTTIIFDFASKTVTAVGAGPAGAQQLAKIAADQHQMHQTSGRPAE